MFMFVQILAYDLAPPKQKVSIFKFHKSLFTPRVVLEDNFTFKKKTALIF